MGNQRKIGELNTQIEVEKEVQQGKREALYQTNSAQGKFDEEIKRSFDKIGTLKAELKNVNRQSDSLNKQLLERKENCENVDLKISNMTEET